MSETKLDLKRTHYCGLVKEECCGQEVTLMGWAHRRRDHGGVIFIDLRDREGRVQVVFNPDAGTALFEQAATVRNEDVLAVVGQVNLRPEGTQNPQLKTGKIEVQVSQLKILSKAQTPPFYLEEQITVDENIRLKYRYLDLRRPQMQKGLILRHQVMQSIRSYFNREGFLEIETPLLTKSTPEGARDYLVPSRVQPGKFFALPQSPQLFKQLLMVAGFDKYYQIARCFRDEDLRADRQPEFTQLDLEMSFVQVEDILVIFEEMLVQLFGECLGVKLNTPFPRLSYAEALSRFGVDNPDLRFALELVDLSETVAHSQFKVFRQVLEKGGLVKGIRAPGCATYSRKEIADLTELVGIYGAQGLAYFQVTKEGLQSPIKKFFTEVELKQIVEKLAGKPGDLLFFVADEPAVVAAALGHLRLELGRRLNLIKQEEFNFLWVVDFPLFEYEATEKRWVAVHHPFTAPQDEDLAFWETEPQRVKAKAYDLVLNGVEIGGGSIRIHQKEIQELMFKTLGLAAEEIEEKFGFLLEAFAYGVPPHGGMALGLDRLVMLMAGKKSIREVMAFPKTQSALDLMTGAPATVSGRQLEELSLRLNLAKN